MSHLCPHCNSLLGRLHFCGSQRGKNTQLGGVRYVERNTVGSNRTGFWSYNQVVVFDQAKESKAHAVPRGFCANLINALKLLANQQEDGDGLLQNIVKDLGKENRKCLTDGLRIFIRNDNERAL